MKYVICSLMILMLSSIMDLFAQQNVKLTSRPIPNHEPKSTLTDTLANGVSIHFISLNKSSFDSLGVQKKVTGIPLESFDSGITKTGNCEIVKLQTGRPEVLCSKKEGDYFEEYLIKGYWREKELLLVNYSNWEESQDFFVELKNGNRYYLDPQYGLSPNRLFMISYTGLNPIYSNELLLTKFEEGKVTMILKLEFAELTITDAQWIGPDQCLLVTVTENAQTSEVENFSWHLMKLN